MFAKRTLFARLAAIAILAFAVATPARADLPVYRHSADIPATASERLKLAARYAEAPGKAFRAPAGPVEGREVVIGNSRFIVVSKTGRNSARAVADAARMQSDCRIAQNATFRTIRAGGVRPTGYAIPCTR